MARSEARVSVDIWDTDEDWRALTPDAQWAYMFLLSQRDLAHDGVLALRERRWARAAAGMTVERIRRSLAELVENRFIVVDEDTEELLIRSLLRRDKIYRQPNVLRAAADHLPLVASQAIRLAIAIELTRITVEEMPDGSKSLISEMLATLPDPLPNPSGNPSPNPSREASADPSGQGIAGTPGVRGVVTAVTTGFPEPRSSKSPDPVPRAPAPPAGGDSPATTDAIIGEWIDKCRKRPAGDVIGQVGKHVKALLADGQDPDDIRAGLEAWRAKGQHPSTLSSFVNAVVNGDAGGARASPRGLVEVNGVRLRPERAAQLADRARWAAADEANARRAIEGS